MIILLIFIQFIFYLLFCFHKLYYLLVNKVILVNIGGKLDKYIDNLENVACNLENAKKIKKFSLINFFNISPSWYKQFLRALFVSTDMLILNISVSYNFFVSNVLFVKIFNRNIEIASILSNNYIIFKFLYYVLFYIFIFCLVYKIDSKLYSLKISKSVNDKNKKIDKFDIVLKNDLNEDIVIKEKGLYQNLLITGSIGSGKTSGAISNILDELLKCNIGGLVIDIKGNFFNQILSMAKKNNRCEDIIEISLNNEYKYNPLNNPLMMSSELANMMKKVLTLITKDNKNPEPFWLDKAEEYIRDFITLIRAYNNGQVNFQEIHNLVIDKDYLNEKMSVLKNLILKNKFSDEEIFDITNAILNIKNDFLNLDHRTLGIIKSEITRMTSIFLSNKKICEKFCSNNNIIDFCSNKIYVLSLDLSNNEKISKIISAYIKLQFQKQALSSNSRDIPIFFLCDEYQEICNSQDATFFSLSREFRCINIVSMQSYSSLINTLGDEHVSNVILQNFINKIWFRNDDDYTIKKIVAQLGKEKQINISKSYSENGKNIRYNILLDKFTSYKSDFSKSYTKAENFQNKYNEEFFTQKLKTFEAMCLISDGNRISLYEKVKFKRWEDDR